MTVKSMDDIQAVMDELRELKDQPWRLHSRLLEMLSPHCPGTFAAQKGVTTYLTFPDGTKAQFATCRLWQDAFTVKDIFDQAVISQKRRNRLI